MLLEVNYRNRRKTIYSCDRCKREVYASEIVGIYMKNEHGSVRRTYDLCKKCLKFWNAYMRKQV